MDPRDETGISIIPMDIAVEVGAIRVVAGIADGVLEMAGFTAEGAGAGVADRRIEALGVDRGVVGVGTVADVPVVAATEGTEGMVVGVRVGAEVEEAGGPDAGAAAGAGSGVGSGARAGVGVGGGAGVGECVEVG